MFANFQSVFSADTALSTATGSAVHVPDVPGLKASFSLFGDQSFNNGLYRVVAPADLAVWQARVLLAFPEFDGQFACFGYDWLGRAFALDLKRLSDGQPGVLLFEPGTGEVLEIPCNLYTFHNMELIEESDACLASVFFKVWLAEGGAMPDRRQCVGYKIPLFLGGEDGPDNFEISDLDVYWHITAQLIEKTKGLPIGTPVVID